MDMAWEAFRDEAHRRMERELSACLPAGTMTERQATPVPSSPTPEQRADAIVRRCGALPFAGMSDAIREAISAAVLAEREACARTAETFAQDDQCIQPAFAGIAAAIRART